MSETTTPLPSFENPPVAEVVLGVQFDPIKGLRTPQIGLLWQEFRERLPITEEQAPLEPVIERFGVAKKPKAAVMLQMLDAPPVPRCWFLNQGGTELVQVQPDRFIHNWRKVGDGDPYPRYGRLRQAFAEELKKFVEFAQREQLGEFQPNQCEVTYINHIMPGEEWQDHGEPEHVVTVFRREYSDSFLGKPEDARLSLRFIIPNDKGDPIGRLYIALDPVSRIKDDAPMLRLSLTARGQPQGEGMEGALRFLDIGREWVVRGFASITTQQMHSTWRRCDGR